MGKEPLVFKPFLSNEEYRKLLNFVRKKLKNTPSTGSEKDLSPQSNGRNFKSSDNLEGFFLTIRSVTRTFANVYGNIVLYNIIKKAYSFERLTKDDLFTKTKAQYAGSISGILLSYRVVYLILKKLLYILKSDNTSSSLYKKSLLIPFISGLAGGAALTICPKGPFRQAIALYMFTKAGEYFYNHLESQGYTSKLPLWFGAWTMFPFCTAQLFTSFIYDRDCCPNSIVFLLKKFSTAYTPLKPDFIPSDSSWPTQDDIFNSYSEIATSGYPEFVPQSVSTGLKKVQPAVALADPQTKFLLSAVTHPFEPSLFLNALRNFVSSLEKSAKLFSPIYGLILLFRLRSFYTSSLSTGILNTSAFKSITEILLRYAKSTVFTSLIFSSFWSGIDLSQYLLHSQFPLLSYLKSLSPIALTQLIAFSSGLWIGIAEFFNHGGSRGLYTYFLRLSLASTWFTLVKRKYVRSLPYGDVVLFAVSFATTMSLLNLNPNSISSRNMRKFFTFFQTSKFEDSLYQESKKNQ